MGTDKDIATITPDTIGRSDTTSTLWIL